LFIVPTVLGGGMVLLFVLFVLKDRRLDRSEQLPPYGLSEFLRSFWINPVQFPDFGWAWISRFIVVTGYAMVSIYQAFFLLNKLHIPASAVPRAVFYGTLAHSATLLVFSVLGGRFSDALGRRKVFVFSASVIYAIAVWVIAIVTHVNGCLAGMALGGLAFGVYLASTWPSSPTSSPTERPTPPRAWASSTSQTQRPIRWLQRSPRSSWQSAPLLPSRAAPTPRCSPRPASSPWSAPWPSFPSEVSDELGNARIATTPSSPRSGRVS
jgi:hypothetical protein